MSRRGRHGANPASYSIRWHSFADVNTPSADIMSSPDPLNDSDEEAIIEPSSAHRATRSVTRSLRSDRYLARDTSPRKQMFELEVGDNKAPQKLLVTVETEGATATVPDGGARRKLFQSSSPLNMIRHRERATTTTVPLKETIEEELADPNATPKRRGRPRKSNGTPIPGAGVKRRAGTPIKRTPRRPRITKSTDLNGELDLGLPELQPEPQPELQPEPQPTTKSARRGRPPKNRITELDDGLELGQPEAQPTPKSARRGRPPKNHTTELSNGTEQPEAQPTPKSKRRGRPPKNRTAEPSSELGIESSRGTTARARGRQAIIPEDLMEMTNEAMDFAPNDVEPQEDNEVTFVIPPSETGASEGPIVAAAEPASEADSDIWMATLDDEPTPRAANQTTQSAPAASSEPDADTSQAGDYGHLAPAASDVSSDDAPPSDSGPGGSDTIAQGEDFSMIFMDSLPSIQELRSSVRMPVEDDYGEETSLIINNTLESLRQSLQKRDESDANKETVEAPEQSSSVPIETGPAEPWQPSIRPPMTFSPNRNLSPRWLRSPRRGNSSPLRRQVLKSKAKQTDDNPQNAGEQTIERQEVTSSEKRIASGHLNEGESNMYDDSFSEIPQDVLQAATPRRPQTTTRNENLMDEEPLEEEPLEEEEVLKQETLQGPFQEQSSQKQVFQGEHLDEEPMEQEYMEEDYVEEAPLQEEDLEEEQPEEDPVEEELPINESAEENQEMEDAPQSQHIEEPSIPESASNMSFVSRSDAGPLPTPDDTPPQIEAQAEDQEKSIQASQPSVGAVSPKTSSPLAVSARRSQVVPEIVEEMVDDLEEELPRDLEPDASRLWLDSHQPRPKVTPVNQMTSPLQDPQSLAPETTQEKISRPLLSPIVRAGRALQSVTSDPPSPEPREHQLRSPFRSSVPRELGPTALDTQTIRRKSMSPRRPLSFPPANPSPSAGQLYEDPFGSDSRHTGQHSFMEALERSTGNRSSQRTQSSPSESLASSMRIVLPDDVKMSWVADEGPISANLRGYVPLKDFARSTTANVANNSMFQAQNDEMVDEVDDQPREGDDDTDIWEFEAERETPRTTRQRPFGNRRRALPNTWTKDDTRRSQRDASLASRREKASPVEKAAPEEAQADDYSLLAQRQAAKEPQAAPQSVTKASRFDLSSFFSSPAAIPGMLAEKFLPSKTTPSFGARPTEPEPVQAAPALLTSSMFSQVAQKEFQPRNSPRKDLFSPAKVAQREFQQQSSPHEDPFSVPRARELEPSLEEQLSPQQTPEDFEMPSVAQKQNFTPQPKLPDAGFFKSSARSAAPTPPRMQLSHADIQRWQYETSVASESPETSGTLLRPLPARNASPSKSSLRSPLKPHTPGRVVEFTSSVLSPVEQAKVRQMRRLSNSSASQPAPPPQRPPPQRVDKENHDATDISMSDASPLAKTPQPEPLSQSVWTRQHWLLLDEFLQLRRAGLYELIYERRADKYLGKTVKSHGETMIMERWHLDIVDAFKAAVGGWDEATLVKRLFALIVGEEKRGQGIVERPSRVMFH
ncbi:hypothetical protein QQZ08_009658 [Neonectria magnoliae]|uniref:Uncharacterized protein n=1 Tax=Neonectria magnoliae TaxID=2732573 RepID=A0ABR1HLD0_9HYPO